MSDIQPARHNRRMKGKCGGFMLTVAKQSIKHTHWPLAAISDKTRGKMSELSASKVFRSSSAFLLANGFYRWDQTTMRSAMNVKKVCGWSRVLQCVTRTHSKNLWYILRGARHKSPSIREGQNEGLILRWPTLITKDSIAIHDKTWRVARARESGCMDCSAKWFADGYNRDAAKDCYPHWTNVRLSPPARHWLGAVAASFLIQLTRCYFTPYGNGKQANDCTREIIESWLWLARAKRKRTINNGKETVLRVCTVVPSDNIRDHLCSFFIKHNITPNLASFRLFLIKHSHSWHAFSPTGSWMI